MSNEGASNDEGRLENLPRFGQHSEESSLSPCLKALLKPSFVLLHLADLGDNMAVGDTFLFALERGDNCVNAKADSAELDGVFCLFTARRPRPPLLRRSSSSSLFLLVFLLFLLLFRDDLFENVGDFLKMNLVGELIAFRLSALVVSHDSSPYNR